jgi:AbrB family looped-hinge helix DNA binding protein
MKAALDRFGRVIIPKRIREHLGLDAGTMLSIEENEGAILLKPIVEMSHVEMKDGVLVFTGKATGDLENAVRKHREERLGEYQ